MMPRYYLRELGGAAVVDKLIGLSPSNRGTAVLGLGRLPGRPVRPHRTPVHAACRAFVLDALDPESAVPCRPVAPVSGG